MENLRTIHLPSTPTIIISSEPTAARIPKITSTLSALGFKHLLVLTGRRTRPYYTALKASVRLALKHPAPLLILEDDATPHPHWYRPTLTIPADTDAVNIGSAFAGANVPHVHGWQSAPVNNRHSALQFQTAHPGYIRIGNMLYAHAILFLTPHAILHYRNATKFPDNRDDNDHAAQIATRTLAPFHPFFYQTDGRHEAITLAGLTPLLRPE